MRSQRIEANPAMTVYRSAIDFSRHPPTPPLSAHDSSPTKPDFESTDSSMNAFAAMQHDSYPSHSQRSQYSLNQKYDSITRGGSVGSQTGVGRQARKRKNSTELQAERFLKRSKSDSGGRQLVPGANGIAEIHPQAPTNDEFGYNSRLIESLEEQAEKAMERSYSRTEQDLPLDEVGMSGEEQEQITGSGNHETSAMVRFPTLSLEFC